MDERGQLIRLQHDDGYPAGFTLVDNRDIWTKNDRNRRLLLRPLALGVYVAMRSLPGGWEFREPWLMEHLDMGRDALRHAIRDLESANRLTRAVQRDDQGRYIRTIWTLHRAGTSPLTGFPSPGSPLPEHPTAGKPHCRENRTRISKEGASNTELITTTTPDLIWPLWFDDGQRVVVAKWMDGLDQMLQQRLLDHFQGRIEKNPPDSPLDWFFGTIKNAHNGGFVPSYGLAVAARRDRCAQETADKEAAKVAEAEAEKRKSELQALLDQMDDAQVRELLATNPLLTLSKIDNWLENGRKDNMLASLARAAIGGRR